jgi:hypothetical protein
VGDVLNHDAGAMLCEAPGVPVRSVLGGWAERHWCELKGSPVDWYGTLPDGATPDGIRRGADAAGIMIRRLPHGDRWDAKGVTPEQNRVFTETLWSFRQRGVAAYTPPSETSLPGVVEQELVVGMVAYTPPQLLVGIDEIASQPADSVEELLVGTADPAPEQEHNSNRELPTTSSDGSDRPTCHLCDSDKWQGWIHDHDSWDGFPWARELLVKAHYPFTCGYVREEGATGTTEPTSTWSREGEMVV